jgi:hypothetical protein
LRPAIASILLVFAARAALADPVVNCDRGQSLNRALQLLPRDSAPTLTVIGTCTEYVSVSGFDGLSLVSKRGAVIRQPSFTPSLLTGVLTIAASRGVTIDGLTILTTGGDPAPPAVWVHDGATQVHLRRTSIVGLGPGILVSDMSEVSMVGLTVRTQGWGAVGIWHSKASMEDSLLENPTDGYQNGIHVGQNAVLQIHGTTIRHMWEGITARDGGTVSVQDSYEEVPLGGPSEVVIDGPPPIQLWGLGVRNGGKVTLGAKLRILNPGSWWGGETGGVELDGTSSLTGGQYLEIRDSLGQGVFVRNSSHASLGGAQIAGTAHNAVAAVNQSTVDLGDPNATPTVPTAIVGSGVNDLYCDGTSLITGAANAPGAARIDCSSLLTVPYPPLP